MNDGINDGRVKIKISATMHFRFGRSIFFPKKRTSIAFETFLAAVDDKEICTK